MAPGGSAAWRFCCSASHSVTAPATAAPHSSSNSIVRVSPLSAPFTAGTMAAGLACCHAAMLPDCLATGAAAHARTQRMLLSTALSCAQQQSLLSYLMTGSAAAPAGPLAAQTSFAQLGKPWHAVPCCHIPKQQHLQQLNVDPGSCCPAFLSGWRRAQTGLLAAQTSCAQPPPRCSLVQRSHAATPSAACNCHNVAAEHPEHPEHRSKLMCRGKHCCKR